MIDAQQPVDSSAIAESQPSCLTSAEQIELLQFSIGRYDHYFDAVNNKANFWLAFDSFVLGAVVVSYKDFVQPLTALLPVPNVALWLDAEIIAFITLSLVSIGLILSASFPFSKPPKKDASQALSSLYYDHVAARTLPQFTVHLNQLQLDHLAADYHSQAHQLSQGLAGKYRRLRWAGLVLFAQLVLLAVLFLTFFLS